jgi:hypothetical protein
MKTRTRNRLVAETVAKNRLVVPGLAAIEAREQKGMSASELAEASGIPLRSLEGSKPANPILTPTRPPTRRLPTPI